MDLLFICKDALANSIVDNLITAMEAKNEGSDVGVLFTQAALVALTGETIEWSPALTGQYIRLKMAKAGATFELPIAGSGQGVQIDTRQLVVKAKEKGISMYASPTWTKLAGLEGQLPTELTEIDSATVLKTIREAKTVIGSL
ncbi:MAG: hypothetical protein SVY53_00115 [Chloroflexota bacterium]|nr:hypothetical protein [Chloroflexota bacterium]